MLKIRAPLELKVSAAMARDHSGEYNRITANYSLMASQITPEEMLHVMTSPPEIYLAEGGTTTVTGNTFLSNRREENIEIINNVLNRIMVSADMPLTYQDRVYISDVLKKIGIRDDRKFMNEVRQMMQETKDTNELINIFLTRPEQFVQYVNEYTESLAKRQKAEEESEPAPEVVNHLAQNILNRLETGAIYQILANFNRSLNLTRIDEGEIRISEQSYTAQQILLSRIREAAFGEPPELVYKSENVYEEEFGTEEHEEKNVTNEINSAVFLDLIRNLYHSEFDRISFGENRWFEFGNVLYNTSSNTISRLQGTTQNLYVSMDTQVYPSEAEITLRTEEIPVPEEETEVITQTDRLVEELEKIDRINQENVGKYHKMMELVSRIRESERKTGGALKTKKASLTALKGSSEVLSRLKGEEEESDRLRREVFREVERLFPDNSGQILNLVEQYISGGSLPDTSNISIVRNDMTTLLADIERVENESRTQELILRESENEASQAVQTLEKLNKKGAAEAEGRNTSEPEKIGLVHRREETLSAEEINETLAQMRKDINKNRVEENIHTDITDSRQNVRRETSTQTTTITEHDRADIQDLVNQGLRRQVGTISEEVLRKLERRLSNEKSRRGI